MTKLTQLDDLQCKAATPFNKNVAQREWCKQEIRRQNITFCPVTISDKEAEDFPCFILLTTKSVLRYRSSYVQDVTSLITYRCCHDVLQLLNGLHLKMTFKLRLSHENWCTVEAVTFRPSRVTCTLYVEYLLLSRLSWVRAQPFSLCPSFTYFHTAKREQY